MIVKINNGSPLSCTEGSLLTKNYNETLDSGNIRISHLTSILDIEPYDIVAIYFGNTITVNPDMYMLVDSFECIEEGLDDIHYTYDISLFSVTKKLENTILPNLAITPLNENPRSIYYYIVQYLKEYAPDIYDYCYNETDWFVEHIYPKFYPIKCPEIQWNAPTLREVLNDLMMVADCIAILVFDGTGYKIDYMDLTVRGLPITDYNYIRRSRSSQDYVSDIRMDLQNAMEDTADLITERIAFTSDSSVITSENFVLKTQFPIKKINHLWMYFCPNATIIDSSTYWDFYKADLISLLAGPLVLEKSEYDTKEIIYKPTLATLTPGSDAYNYQNFTVYFTRYSNVIESFSEEQATGIVGLNLKTKAELLGYIIAKEMGANLSNFKADTLSTISTTYFEIEYETTHDSVFSAGKKGKLRNKREIVDNQTNSFVNTRIQATLEYQKVDRLGNEQMMINQRTDSIANAIQLAQVHNDSVVYQTQYQIYSDHVEVNALATKNYILRNYFTGVKSHIRTWVNARDEALIRHELIKERYEFSYTSNSESHSLFLTPFKSLNFSGPVNACGCQIITNAYTPSTYLPSSSTAFSMETINRILGNSIVLTIAFSDNAIFKRAINFDEVELSDIASLLTEDDIITIKDSFNSSYGGIPTKNYFYVNDNYEFYGLNLIFYHNEVSSADHEYVNVYDGKTFIKNSIYRNSTTVLTGDIFYDTVLTRTVMRHKDNKEIFKLSYQFEFGVEDVEKIIIGDEFLNRQLIFAQTDDYNFRVFINNNETNNFTINVGANYVECIVPSATSDDFVYIYDSSGEKLIIGFKYESSRLYLSKKE